MDENMEILKKIPMPGKAWPFADMDIGDCVKVADNARHNAARAYIGVIVTPKTGFRFITRNIDGVLHVWRTQ